MRSAHHVSLSRTPVQAKAASGRGFAAQQAKNHRTDRRGETTLGYAKTQKQSQLLTSVALPSIRDHSKLFPTERKTTKRQRNTDTLKLRRAV